MKKLIFLLALVAAVAQAEVYKSVNEKGEVVYSDTPSRGSERMKLPALPTYTAPPVPPSSSAARQSVQNAFYESFAFSKPGNDETVRNNLGIIMIETRLAPALQTKLGHRIQYYLDGKPNGPLIDRTAITLSNIDRGAHTLSASVLDKDGNVLVSTGDITVHVKRQSSLYESDDYSNLSDQPAKDDIPEGDRKILDAPSKEQPLLDSTPNLRDETPNLRGAKEIIKDAAGNEIEVYTPNIRTNTPNIRTTTPNIINPTPNIINPPAPAPAPAPAQ